MICDVEEGYSEFIVDSNEFVSCSLALNMLQMNLASFFGTCFIACFQVNIINVIIIIGNICIRLCAVTVTKGCDTWADIVVQQSMLFLALL